jgi:hypothetical protein
MISFPGHCFSRSVAAGREILFPFGCQSRNRCAWRNPDCTAVQLKHSFSVVYMPRPNGLVDLDRISCRGPEQLLGVGCDVLAKADARPNQLPFRRISCRGPEQLLGVEDSEPGRGSASKGVRTAVWDIWRRENSLSELRLAGSPSRSGSSISPHR